MVAEYGRPEREKFDCVEYLGFCPTKDRLVKREPSDSGKEDLIVEPATEVLLEVYSHPDAQVRVYIRPDTPALVVLSLLEKIATAIEVEQYVHNERDRAPNDAQADSERRSRDDEEQGRASCRRCNLSLLEKSSIRDELGPLCISCAKELQLI